MQEKEQRLKQLKEQAAGMKEVPVGLKLAITQLEIELGISSDQCSLDDGCLNCGS